MTPAGFNSIDLALCESEPRIFSVTFSSRTSARSFSTSLIISSVNSAPISDLLFGAIFAINSAVHSYLILAFGDAGRITRDVGFYYMANAAGRLVGTLLSGLSYQAGGLPLCLATAGAMALAGWIGARRLRADGAR